MTDPGRKEAPATCAEIAADLDAFVGRGEALRAPARAHLEGCDACRERYRSAVHAAAALARSRGDAFQRTVTGARSTSRPMRVPRKVVGLLVLAAGVSLWMMPGRERTFVHALRGEMRVGEHHRVAGEEPVEARPGMGASTGDDGAAAIERKGTRVVAGAATGWSFELGDGLALRLFDGELDVEGPVRVLTAFGAFASPGGAARLELRGAELTIVAHGQGARFESALGTRDLVPGERLEVGLRDLSGRLSSAR